MNFQHESVATLLREHGAEGAPSDNETKEPVPQDDSPTSASGKKPKAGI